MAGVTWCEQDGVPYLFVDYSGTTEAELLAVMAEGTEAVRAAPYGLRMLVDVTDTPFSRAFLKGVKDSTA